MPTPKAGVRALRKGRYNQKNGIYFVTTVTRARKPWFQDFTLACAMSRLLEDPNTLRGSRNLCWVVMPDHVHLLLQVETNPISEAVARIKSISARALNKNLKRTGPFWAPGFYDHGLRDTESLRSVARYIVANPVRANLAPGPAHYPFWNAIYL